MLRRKEWRLLEPGPPPTVDQRFAEAAGEVRDCDVIVMHCMGYDDNHRATVREVTGKPVLLAQRMLAAGVAQLV